MTSHETFPTRQAADWRAVYICSASRSGSTLTDMLLGGHSDAASLGEVNFLSKALKLGEDCTCGAKVGECESWGQVLDAIARARGVDLRTQPYALRLWDAKAANKIDHEHQTKIWLLGMYLRKAWLDVRERMPRRLRDVYPIPGSLESALSDKLELYGMIARAWRKQVLVDSSKNVREAVELYHRAPHRIRIVLLTRDGRGTFLSHRNSGRSKRDSVQGWVRYYQRALPMLERNLPGHALVQMKYEDLAARPEEACRALCGFAGLTFQDDMLDLSRAVRHMVHGNDTRFTTTKGIRLDERWRRELGAEDLDFFERNGGADMNARLGYR